MGAGASVGNVYKLGQIAVGGGADFDGVMESAQWYSSDKGADWIKRQWEFGRSRLGDRQEEGGGAPPSGAGPTITSFNLTSTSSFNLSNGTLNVAYGALNGSTPAGTGGLTSTLTWYVNGTANSTFDNMTVIGSGNLTKNYNWSVALHVRDVDGSANQSESIIVRNALPTPPTTLTHNIWQLGILTLR